MAHQAYLEKLLGLTVTKVEHSDTGNQHVRHEHVTLTFDNGTTITIWSLAGGYSLDFIINPQR